MSIMERGSERALGREPSDTAKSSGQVDNVYLAALTDNCKLMRLINSVGGYSVERLCTGQPVMSPVVASSPNRDQTGITDTERPQARPLSRVPLHPSPGSRNAPRCDQRQFGEVASLRHLRGCRMFFRSAGRQRQVHIHDIDRTAKLQEGCCRRSRWSTAHRASDHPRYPLRPARTLGRRAVIRNHRLWSTEFF